ncbi:ABC transporter permease [Paramicrobacterium agarici]|uniref:Transport permease protein n=1 Tax=Paramicrobacterium agarici TaxID=630514 RepID=A0A2A9DW62_9MICO|nr:ABC transporter permease [Microbacterium agarici]PFG30928.1 ABC-2 type transport system permease protein [Microbacterium agarici]
MTIAISNPRTKPRAGNADAVFIARSIRHSLRDGEGLLMAILLPVFMMGLFVFVFGGAMSFAGDSGYVNYIVPGIIIMCAGFGASSTATLVAGDMQSGIVDRFRTMPIRGGAVLTGHVVASVLRNLVATGVVVLVGLLAGFRPSAGLGGWLGALAIITVYILTITMLFAAVGLVAGSVEAANAYGFVLLFLPYLSSGFVPVETMPSWLEWIARYQPITPVIEAIRALLSEGDVGVNAVFAMLWCAGILAIALAWSAVMFRRKAGRR